MVSEFHAQWLLALHFRYGDSTMCFPEFYINGYEMDFAAIAGNGTITEVEIKSSIPSYHQEKLKTKWNRLACKYFYYCAEKDNVIKSILKHSDKRFGVLKIVPCSYDDTFEIKTVRRPEILKNHVRLTIQDRLKLLKKTSAAYWKFARPDNRFHKSRV